MKNGKHTSSAKVREDNSKIQKLSINSNFSENLNLFKPSNGILNNHNQLLELQNKEDKSTLKEGNQNLNGIKSNMVPVKPIPQRVNGSKINILLNACKINNYMKTPTVSMVEESTKKREEKANSKRINEIVNNSEEGLLSNNSHSLAKNMQETIAALLKMQNTNHPRSNSDEMLLSSCEEKEVGLNLNTTSSSKLFHKLDKKRGEYYDCHNSIEKHSKFSSYNVKKGRHSNSKGLKRSEFNNYYGEDEGRVSNVVKTVQVGSVKKLILDSGTNIQHDASICFNMPSKSLKESFGSCINTPNLSSILSINIWAKDENSNSQNNGGSNLNGSICMKIVNLIRETYRDRIEDSKEQKRDRVNADLKINSVPIINAFDLRLF